MAQPTSGMATSSAYSSQCEAWARNCIGAGMSAGRAGGLKRSRTISRTITSTSKVAPSGRWMASSHWCFCDTVVTMPTPTNSMARISTAMVQCSRRASG